MLCSCLTTTINSIKNSSRFYHNILRKLSTTNGIRNQNRNPSTESPTGNSGIAGNEDGGFPAPPPPPPREKSPLKPMKKSDYTIMLGYGWRNAAQDGMRLWRMHNYGGPSELMPDLKNYPRIQSPYDVVVKVLAASVNQIDLAMTYGYGAEFFNTCKAVQGSEFDGYADKVANALRNFTRPSVKPIEFPMTLGRDFAGTVVEIGYSVKTDLQIGDDVWGILPPFLGDYLGSHCDCIVGPADFIRKKPENLDFIEAASIPYVALTAWSAIRLTGGFRNCENRRFLVVGASGGVGTFAVQYLKALGATVFASCSLDSIPLVENLGADVVLDYRQDDYIDQLLKVAPFDCILDFSGNNTMKERKENEEIHKTLKPITGQYITLSPPLLRNMDNHGFIGGSLKSLADLLSSNVNSIRRDRILTKWAFFVPNGDALDSICRLVEEGKINPVIEKVYPFTQVPEAFTRMDQGHMRGKLVINMVNPD